MRQTGGYWGARNALAVKDTGLHVQVSLKDGVIELWGILLYAGDVLFHVEWCIRQL